MGEATGAIGIDAGTTVVGIGVGIGGAGTMTGVNETEVGIGVERRTECDGGCDSEGSGGTAGGGVVGGGTGLARGVGTAAAIFGAACGSMGMTAVAEVRSGWRGNVGVARADSVGVDEMRVAELDARTGKGIRMGGANADCGEGEAACGLRACEAA